MKSLPVEPKLSDIILVAYIPETKSKLSPGKKKPTNKPVSAKIINNTIQSPPFVI
ncbi:hypothetical protein E27107_180052 [Elizabethkingia anophelis]|nr:hypothetical protein E27107_180052 [Elizabethkingia anophelis]